MAMSATYGSVINVVLNVVLVFVIGIQGATIATAVSSFSIFIIRKLRVGKEITIEKYGTVLTTWGLLCVQAVIEIYTPFWYAELVLMMLMLLINLKNMQNIVGFIFHRQQKN